MVSLKAFLVAAAQVLSVAAIDIKVKSSGGNATSGHQYGFLHEVQSPGHHLQRWKLTF